MKIFGILFLLVGVVVLGFGITAMNSFASEVSEALSGMPTDRAFWLTISGVALTALGTIFLSQIPSRSHE